ncbi:MULTISPECIES: type II toxin-antitoxin system ParD family antitoxin [Sphingomonas]|uniref:type II toxin-antitoxin system ParD family antitoxin n=1 Tax=Sphingomonas TaxID=13687 RepID=UPI0018DD6041|nr:MULTISPECIES: type II toxin-antitoxin system ParD family antitoxin [Sphingomonas]
MAQINVSLPDGLKKWVDDQVATGRYSSASDYIREILRADEDRAARLAWAGGNRQRQSVRSGAGLQGVLC